MNVLASRLRSVLLAAVLTMAAALPIISLGNLPFAESLFGAALFGASIGAFEEFYVHSRRGVWLRRMQPLIAMLLKSVATLFMAVAVIVVNNILWGTRANIEDSLRRLFGHLPLLFAMVLVIVLVLRVIHFIGGRNLYYLAIGYYHRPIEEQKVLAFIDLKGSTTIVEKLGALRAKSMIGRVLFDLSRLVTEHKGEVYVYTGDGLVAIWDWSAAINDGTILEFARATATWFQQEAGSYAAEFSVAPELRIGIHGGPVILSEQGDTRRSIGIYGDTINIAARLEQAGKQVGRNCVVSADIVKAIGASQPDLTPLPPIDVKGISHPIAIYGLGAAV